MACTEAVAREPENWRHSIRLAHAWWGEDRRCAAERLLSLAPQLAVARWLAATVLIARRAFPQALDHLHAGCELQDAQPAEGGRFATVGLHLLRGFVLLENDGIEDALAEFTCELASPPNQIYSRECFANTHYAIGAAQRRLGRLDAAKGAFLTALAYVEGHGRATAGLATLASATEITGAWHAHGPVEAAIVRSIPLACAGLREESAAIVLAALEQAPPGQSGWQLPIEPLLHTSAHPDAWSRALELVAMRAM